MPRSDGRRIAVFTICATNYLPQARVLAASLACQHHGLRLKAVLLDDDPGASAGAEPFDLIPAAAFLDQRSWTHKRCYYDVLELATSIKAECFLHFLGEHDAVFYFDPDIRLFGPVPALDRWPMDDASAVLTPHLLHPLPDDGRYPDNLTILRAGEYNLGFAGFRRCPEAMAFLQWWAGALERLCLADTGKGVFTDQKWVNFATSFMPRVRIDHDPGCNAAYWNLHERIPIRTADGWQVETIDGMVRPLRFYHFSGFSPGQATISKHETRFGTAPPGDTPVLLAEYDAALRAAGHGTGPQEMLAPPRFAEGMAWDPICRDLYRSALAAGIAIGDPLRDPAFLDWAGAAEEGMNQNRYARAVLARRRDVARAYRDGEDGAGLLRWLHGRGGSELDIDPALLDRLGIGAVVPGVHYVGYLRAHLGIAEAARGNIAALREAGIAVRTHDISDSAAIPLGTYSPDAAISAMAGSAAQVAILGVNADMLPGILPHLPPAVTAAYRIGCWYWETPEFPDAWCDRFDLVDEVWAATEYVARAIREKATVPVVVMPPMVCPPPLAPDRPWVLSLLPEAEATEFLFLFQFDVASVPFRKNPEGAILAFARAFTPQEPVRLIVKLLNAAQDPALVTQLRGLAEGRRISLLDAPLESLDRFRLLAGIDCFVSLHRAEGFGLSIAEAMAYGVPVVTTGWSGNADFTSPENAALVAFDIRPTAQPHGPYPPGTRWAEPRLDDAARQMRRILDDPTWRRTIGEAGARTIRAQFSAATVGAAMRSRLIRIAGSARMTARANGSTPARDLPASPPASALAPGRRGDMSLVARDVLRFPGYYLSRLPRLPGLLLAQGTGAVVERAVSASTQAAPSHKKQYAVGSTVRRLLKRLGRSGSRRSAGP